ncbi:MAG: helix-turn-helix domain-containing protein [Verrucomicrobiota bacterium]
MESNEVIREAFQRVSPKEVASEMGLSLSMVYKWAQPATESGSGSRNPLDRVAQLMELTKEPKIIQWLCQQSGGHFVGNPSSDCEKGYEVIPATNEIVQQFAGLLATISQAALDNSITDSESEDIREVWDELKGFCEGFVKCCEEGDFENIKSPRLR